MSSVVAEAAAPEPQAAPGSAAEEGIITRREGAIAFLELNRPDKLNAFTSAMYEEMIAAIEAAERDDAVRVMLIHGRGRAFTAGNDIHDFLHTPLSGPAEELPPSRFFRTIAQARKPIVAAVHGAAVGVGTTMLLHCDLVYAAPETRFQLPFVNLGIVPEAGSSYLLTRMAGHQRAAEALLLGRPLDAETLHGYGLVTGIVPADQVLATATSAAQELAGKPAEALRATKRLMKAGTEDTAAAIMGAEMKEMVLRVQSADAKEAFTAFLEKRPPRFQ